MEIQKIFSEIDTNEKLYSVLMTEEELSLFSEIKKEMQRMFSLRINAPEIIELGDGISLVKAKFGIIARLLRHIKPLKESQDKLLIYDVKLGNKGIGYLQVHEDIPDNELNIVWLEIDKKYEGNHYATETMKAIIKWAKNNGYKRLTLEVPGISPNARHIYEKLGFKVTSKTIGNKNDMWGGLTCMECYL